MRENTNISEGYAISIFGRKKTDIDREYKRGQESTWVNRKQGWMVLLNGPLQEVQTRVRVPSWLRGSGLRGYP